MHGACRNIRGREQRGLLVLFLGLAVLMHLGGCASGGPRRSRGKVSDATAEAAGIDRESTTARKGPPPDDESPDTELPQEEAGHASTTISLSGHDHAPLQGTAAAQAEPKKPAKPKNRFRNLSFWFSQSRLAGDAIHSFSDFTIMYGDFPAKRVRVDIGLYAGHGRRGSQPNVQAGIRSINEVGIELNGRFYFTPAHTLMGAYVLGGLRWGILDWNYSKDIAAPDEDGKIQMISGDQVEQVTYFIGLGTSLLQTKAVHLGVSATAGIRVFDPTTFEDFENDLFKDVGEFRLNMVASFHF